MVIYSINTNMIRVFVVAFDNDILDINTNFLENVISEERRRKTRQLIRQKDKKISILSELLIKYVINKYYNVNEVSFEYGKYGKPYLCANSDIYFNISHSNNYIVCGVGEVEIGIDIQYISYDIMDIVKRFFTKEENEYICNHSENICNEMAYKFWTLKESYIKCIGMGLNIPLDSFSLRVCDNNIRLYNGERINELYTFYNIKCFNKYYLSLCCEKKNNEIWDEYIEILTVDEILKWTLGY